MNIGEKVSYIKGLAEGLALDTSNKEGKVIAAILDVLSDIADNLSEIDEELDDVATVMSDLEESVSDIEDELYGADDDYDDYDEDADLDSALDEMYETTCPKCHNTIRFDYEQAAQGGMDCPNCGQRLEFELDGDEGEEL